MNESVYKAFLTKFAAGVVTFAVVASVVGATVALDGSSQTSRPPGDGNFHCNTSQPPGNLSE